MFSPAAWSLKPAYLAIAGGCLLTLLVLLSRPETYVLEPFSLIGPGRNRKSSGGVCYPYNEPGILRFNILEPSLTRYFTLNSTCKAHNDLYPRLKTRDEVDYLRNRTVLVLGDSIDRGLVVFLGDVPGAVHDMRSEEDPDRVVPFSGGTLENGLPRHTTLPDLNFHISNFFLYGLDEQALWSSHPSFLPPFILADRWKMIESNWQSRSDSDIVILQAGIWDLGRYQHPLVQPSEQTDQWRLELDPAFLEKWMDEARLFIDRARVVFPASQLYWRVLHDASAPLSFFGSRSNCIHPLRIEQLRQAQRKVIAEKGVPAIPLGPVLQNQPFEYRPDGLHLGPAANALYAEMLLAALQILPQRKPL